MRVLSVVVVSALIGILAGGAIAYVEVTTDRDAIGLPSSQPVKTAELPIDDSILPRLQLDEPAYNFGNMQRGRKKSHRFALKNVGTAPLTVDVGKPSCSCTVAAVSEMPIPPGGTGSVTLEWTASGVAGPVRHTAPLHTNDPLKSALELSIEGMITDAEGISPPEFLLGSIPIGEQRTAEVVVMAMLQDELTVEDLKLTDESLRDKFDVKVDPLDKDSLPNPNAKAGVKIMLTAKSDLPLGFTSNPQLALAMKTNLEDGEYLEIPVIGRVVGDISVHGTGWSEEQACLMLGSVKSSEGRKATLSLIVQGDGAADVKFALKSSDPPELKAVIGEPRKFKDTLLHVPVEIEVPPGTRPMVRTDTSQGDAGQIVLTTTHPKIKEMVLGVRFSVQR
jgi:hypothetical protein